MEEKYKTYTLSQSELAQLNLFFSQMLPEYPSMVNQLDVHSDDTYSYVTVKYVDVD